MEYYAAIKRNEGDLCVHNNVSDIIIREAGKTRCRTVPYLHTDLEQRLTAIFINIFVAEAQEITQPRAFCRSAGRPRHQARFSSKIFPRFKSKPMEKWLKW